MDRCSTCIRSWLSGRYALARAPTLDWLALCSDLSSVRAPLCGQLYVAAIAQAKNDIAHDELDGGHRDTLALRLLNCTLWHLHAEVRTQRLEPQTSAVL